MRQYELWWATLPNPAGRRPVLLLSRDPAYSYLHKVIIAEVTTTIRGIPQEVHLGRRHGLAGPCVANLDSLHVVPTASLRERIGALPASRHVEVKRALGFALDFGELQML